MKTSSDFGAMGYCIGEKAKGRHVAFTGVGQASEDNLKALGAAMAASGSAALFYVKGITPEYRVADKAEEIAFTQGDLKATREKMGTNEKPQLVAIGCPHASIGEIAEVGNVVADTCMVVCPLEEMGYKVTASNSGKAAKYPSSMQRQKVVFGDVKEIIFR